MKHSSILLLVFVYTFIVSCIAFTSPIPTPTPPQNKYLLAIQFYQYDIVGCANKDSSSHHDSSNGMASSSSFELVEDRIGTIDGGGGPSSTEESSEESLCDNSQLNRVVYTNFDTCVTIDNSYFIYSLMYNNGTIRRDEYFNHNCTEGTINGQPLTIYIKPLDCLNSCVVTPKLYSVITPSDIIIPVNTVVFVAYLGNCYESWKKDFKTVDYRPLDSCLSTGLSSSVKFDCNTTTLLAEVSNQYDCNQANDFIYSDVGVTACYSYPDDVNQRTICNI